MVGADFLICKHDLINEVIRQQPVDSSRMISFQCPERDCHQTPAVAAWLIPHFFLRFSGGIESGDLRSLFF
jgi:hypothetical protein